MLTHALTLKPDVSQDAEQKQNQMSHLPDAVEKRGRFTRKGVRSVGSKLIGCRAFRKRELEGASERKVNLLNFEFLRADLECRKNPVNDLVLDSFLIWMSPEAKVHKKKNRMN